MSETNDGFKEVSVMWAGGWDDYLIDPDHQRKVTAEEQADYDSRVARGFGGDPVVEAEDGSWLRPGFIYPVSNRPDLPEDVVVKIKRHLRGGD